MKLFKIYWWGVLIFSIVASPAIAQTPPSPETYIKLTKPVPYVEQSTASTCWLASASMICGYYGQNFTEKDLSEKVGKISMLKKLKEKFSKNLKGDQRACLIALSQTEGLIEFTLNQAPKAVADVGTIISNSASGPGNVVLSLTNASGTQPRIDLATGTNLQSDLWKLRTADLNYVEYAKALLFLYQTSKAKMAETLVTALANATPVVIICEAGTPGHSQPNEHAMVVTGVKIAAAQASDVTDLNQIISVDVLDPAPGAGSHIQVINGDVLRKDLNAVYTKEIALHYLDMERQSLEINTNETDNPSPFQKAIKSPLFKLFN